MRVGLVHLPVGILYVLFLLSGATGLVYELVWVRELILVFGGTTFAITTVLVSFMGGLGLGSYLAGRWTPWLNRPERVYGVLEICIGLYALLVSLLFGFMTPAYRALYPHVADAPWLLTLARFALSAIVLVLPTTCMGATLPILVRYVTLGGGTAGRSVGVLYGINTLGAVLGVLAAGFVLLPSFGLTTTTWLAAAVNVAIGAAALGLLRPASAGPEVLGTPGRPVRPAPAGPRVEVSPPWPITAGLRRAVLLGFAISGFAAMVYQITWTRALVMSVGSSTYSYTCILAAFILGLALGSLIAARWVDRWKNPVAVFGGLELLIGLVAVLIVPIHGYIPVLMRDVVNRYYENWGLLLAVQFLLIIAVTLVPTLLMGAIFPLVTRVIATSDTEAGAATGRAYLVNTLGTILGSFLAGFVLIRSAVLGVQNSIVLASVLNGAVGVLLVMLARRTAGQDVSLRRWLVPVAGLMAILILGLGTGRWDPRTLTTAPYLRRLSTMGLNREIIFYAEGVDVTVAVEKGGHNRPDSLALTVNGKADASTGVGDMTTQLLLGHLPTLVQGGGRSACVIGLGSGMTLSAVARHAAFERIECAEISDDVIRAAALFAPFNYDILTADPRVHLYRADGRNHLLLTDRQYDVIISEPSNPWISGVSNLFTREFYELARSRLAPGGVFAGWLHNYSMSLHDFRMIVRTMASVFPHVSIWELQEADFMLLGAMQPVRLDYADFKRRLDQPDVLADLYRIGCHHPAHVLGRYIAADDALRAWAAGAPIHTDDNALLEFSAPRNLYIKQGRLILEELVALQRSVWDDLLDRPADEPFAARRVGEIVTARQVWVKVQPQLTGGQLLPALESLVDAYERAPHAIQLFESIQGVVSVVRANPQTKDLPEARQLSQRFELLRPPLVCPPRGGTIELISGFLRSAGGAAAQRREWWAALDCLYQAHRLLPDDGNVLIALAETLVQVQREEEALHYVNEFLERHPKDSGAIYTRAVLALRANDLEQTFQWLNQLVNLGQVSATDLITAEQLRPLHTDPRFRLLLARAQATSRPSAETQPDTSPRQ